MTARLMRRATAAAVVAAFLLGAAVETARQATADLLSVGRGGEQR